VAQAYGDVWTYDPVNQAIIISSPPLSTWVINFVSESPSPPSFIETLQQNWLIIVIATGLLLIALVILARARKRRKKAYNFIRGYYKVFGLGKRLTYPVILMLARVVRVYLSVLYLFTGDIANFLRKSRDYRS
jgi:hypothetical protein